MPMATVQQTSFNGGEISESLYGRTDLTKYDTSVRTMRNFIPTLQGNAVNRPGTQFIAEVIDSTKNSRLIPFQFSVTQAYVLEFGDGIMRIISDGGLVVYPVGHASAGDPVEVVTPYSHDDVFRIQYAQSADVLFLVHPSYPPQKVSRFSNTEWTCETIAFGTSAATPTSIVSDAVGAGFNYKVTSIVDGEESIAGTVTSTTETSTLSWDAVFSATAYNVYKSVSGIYGWVGEAATPSFKDASIIPDNTKRPPEEANPFSAEPVLDSLGPNLIPVMAYVSQTSCAGGSWTASATNWWGTPSAGNFHLDNMFDGGASSAFVYLTNNTKTAVVTIVPVAPVAVGGYMVASNGYDAGVSMMTDWKFEGWDGATWTTLDEQTGVTSWAGNETRIYSFINEVAYTQYRIDILGASRSASGAAIAEFEMFTGTYSTAANYPGSVTLHQQRLVFARTDANPQTIFGSQTGNFYNFNVSNPLQDDDAYEFTIFSNQVNEVQWLAAIRSLLAGSSGAEWEIGPGQNGGAITPTSVNVTSQGNRGSEPIIPIIIGSSLIFVSRGGKSIRDYGYNFDIDGYTGDELTVLANHLFEDSTIKEWASQRNPYSVVWVVMNDGTLRGLTYDKNQQVVGWHKHDTGATGLFESVASIPNSSNDDVYFVVNRTIDGSAVRYIERMAQRFASGTVTPTNAYFVDCGLTYSGAAATVISGLDHLEGEAVAVLADGLVVNGLTVASGAITLPNAASLVYVGLAYTSDLETLDFEFRASNAPTIHNQKRGAKMATVKLRNTSALKIGPDTGSLETQIFLADEDDVDPIPLYTGDKKIPIKPGNHGEAVVFIRNTDPLPVDVQSIITTIEVGDV